jgi:hypothetical protein
VPAGSSTIQTLKKEGEPLCQIPCSQNTDKFFSSLGPYSLQYSPASGLMTLSILIFKFHYVRDSPALIANADKSILTMQLSLRRLAVNKVKPELTGQEHEVGPPHNAGDLKKD